MADEKKELKENELEQIAGGAYFTQRAIIKREPKENSMKAPVLTEAQIQGALDTRNL